MGFAWNSQIAIRKEALMKWLQELHTPLHTRGRQEEEKENHGKRKAEGGGIIEEEIEGRVKSRNMEEEDIRIKQEEASKGK